MRHRREKVKLTRDRILRLPLEKRAEMAFREAVDEVIAAHARLGCPSMSGVTAKL
jgi:hypothetical protein